MLINTNEISKYFSGWKKRRTSKSKYSVFLLIIVQDILSVSKVASFKRSQCEGCSIIIYLMALYHYYLKCIEGRHIKDIFKSSI